MGIDVKRWGAVSAAALAALVIGAAIIVPGVRADGALMSLDPPSQNLATDAASTTVALKVAGASKVASWEVILAYDSAKLDAIEVAEGPFLKTAGVPTQCLRGDDATYVTAAAKTALGVDTAVALQYACIFTDPHLNEDIGANGDGVLATITFKPKQAGNTNLLFLRRVLNDTHVAELPVDSTDGVIQVVAPGAGGALQPTPTANAANLTPVGQPTREVDPFVRGSSGDSTPVAGSSSRQLPAGAQPVANSPDGAMGPPAPGGGGVLSAAGTPGTAGSGASGDRIGAAGNNTNDGFPRAGYGPQPSEPNPVWRILELSFAGLGAALVIGGIARRRLQAETTDRRHRTG